MFAISYTALPATFSGIFTEDPARLVHNWQIFFCVATGLWGGLIIGLFTEYFTSNRYQPVQVSFPYPISDILCKSQWGVLEEFLRTGSLTGMVSSILFPRSICLRFWEWVMLLSVHPTIIPALAMNASECGLDGTVPETHTAPQPLAPSSADPRQPPGASKA